MRRLLFILAILFSISSCEKDKETFEVNPCGVAFETTIKYLAIGDEFNTGLFLQNGEAWPNEVKEYLIDNGYPDIELSIIGEEGLTTTELSLFLNGNSDTDCKNLSTIMIGVHDLLQGHSTADFISDYSSLVESVIAFTNSTQRVTCVGIPDFSQAPGLPASAGTPQEVKAKIQSYNAAIAELSIEKGVGFANIFPISEVSYEFMLAEDDFHPSAPQHLLWANVVAGEVENGLD